MRRVAALVIYLLACVTLSAHGELDKRIKEISIKILQDPTNTSLFLARGELYYQHEDYELSIKDFQVCEERGYISDRLNLNFAKSLRLIRDYRSSDDYADRILSQQPKHVLAIKEKAKSAFDQENFVESASLFKDVINYVDKARTDNYFEAVNALESCGTKDCLLESIDVLENGIGELGELMVFLDKGVSISLRLKDFKRAHEYQNKIIQNAQRKERTFYKKALLFKEQGNMEEAKEMFKSSLSALAALPPRIKDNRASQKLKAQIEEELSAYQ